MSTASSIIKFEEFVKEKELEFNQSEKKVDGLKVLEQAYSLL